MIVVRTVAELRRALAELRSNGQTVGFVPTMGALHAGHLRLLTDAGQDNDLVVLSVFVNPTQFTDSADLAAYPRTEARDQELAESVGVDIYFAPAAAEVYPPGFTAVVALAGSLVDTFEGAHRGAQHFHGVTTVVAKLLLMVGPDRAYFGQKDAQQLRVVRAMVADLNIDVDILAVPTVREPDGLALSSRNVRLTLADRERALGISRALFRAVDLVRAGVADSSSIIHAARQVLDEHAIDPEYLAVVDLQTFASVPDCDAGNTALIVAAGVGAVRLIDNVLLRGS